MTTIDPAAELVSLVRAAPAGSCGAILAPSHARAGWMLRVAATRAGLRLDGGKLHLEDGRTVVAVSGGAGTRGRTLVALWACESMHRLDVEACIPALEPGGMVLR